VVQAYNQPLIVEYIYIASKGSVSAEVDFSNAYNLKISAECKVEFKGGIYVILSSKPPIPQGRDKQPWIDIPGSSVVFQIVGS
jgi:hypothetical protein